MDNECKRRGCRCLRYRENKNEKDKCIFCGHSIGFHEFLHININEHPYGRCNELDCDCQRYKEETSYKCSYCNHSEGHHHRWDNNNTQITQIVIPSYTTTTQITPPHARNNGRNAGRPRADRVIIKHLICFDKALSNKIPKKGTSLWLDLKKKNLIKEDIIIFQTAPEELFNKILNFFSEELNGQGWILYNASSGQPIKVNGEINFDLIKKHVTKAMKKLYIGPSDYDICSSSAEDVSDSLPQVNLNNPIDDGNAGTSANMQIVNLPRQLSTNPGVNDFFNGYGNDFENDFENDDEFNEAFDRFIVQQ
ncbi:hypothetical protein RclHR1_03740001 [Rhizophagus clarus]|uniref:Uncharacterized protein n=1 Tax=Rhizophagus clarus TaxID=94130 RepID=A0A2Z6S719_9GLOM|nr:hypothetical protein RclHR1_03740001 [Rhizophagus clarus]GES82847.1 hypothetical protein GLOIN_2v1591722 [Rhizophagus clarus]